MIIDFVKVFTAFALNYSGKAKARGEDYHSPKDPYDFHNSYWGEKIIGDKLVHVQRIETTGQHIFDVYHNDRLNFEEIIAIRSTLLNDGNGLLWDPSIPVVKRIFEVDNILDLVGKNIEIWVDERNVIACGPIFRHSLIWGYYISDVGEYDFGGDMGKRAYLVITTNPYPNSIQENYGYDIGPGLDMFEPRYGLLAYKHYHSEDAWAIETYNQIVDFTYPDYPCSNLL